MSCNNILEGILDEVKSLEEALTCSVCKILLENPMLIVKCGHTTCKCCFSKHQDMSCPVCEIPVNTKDSFEDKELIDLLFHLRELKSILKDDKISLIENDSPTEPNEQSIVSLEKTVIHEAKKMLEKTVLPEPIETEKTALPEGKETSSPKHYSTPINTRKRVSSRISTRVSGGESKNKEAPVNKNGKTSTSSVGKGKRDSGGKKLSTDSSHPETPLNAGNLNKKNPKGETPLHRAVIKGDIEKVRDLLKKGALVNTQDNNGWTPLHEASNHGFLDITKLLLDHGALANVPSLKDNITPIHDALMNDNIDIAILLASRGADLHVKASFGYNALDLAKTDEVRRSLTDACSPFIEANTIIPSSKAADVESDKVVILYSNLNDEQKLKLQECAQLLNAETVEHFKPDVTHVVTSCDNMGNCTRTMKILMGLLSGKWLINFQWIEVCLEYKRKVEEEVFEVQGTKNQPNTQAPSHARQNILQKFPPLFDGFYFYLHGTFTKPTPLREDLSNLIHMGGGKLLSREPRLDTVSSEKFLMPYHAAGTSLENINHLILYQDKPPRNIHVNSGHICTTQVMWLISCISEYSLLPPKQTSVTD